MKKGQPPVETRADGQGQSQQKVRDLESLPHSQETVFPLQGWTPSDADTPPLALGLGKAEGCIP